MKDISGHCYAAVWNDDAVNVCQMEKWEMAEEETHEKEKSIADDVKKEKVKVSEAIKRKKEENRKKDRLAGDTCCLENGVCILEKVTKWGEALCGRTGSAIGYQG